MWYTIQVSNHPGSGEQPPSLAAAEAWETVYDGPVESRAAAVSAVHDLTAWYRFARLFQGRNVGKLILTARGPA